MPPRERSFRTVQTLFKGYVSVVVNVFPDALTPDTVIHEIHMYSMANHSTHRGFEPWVRVAKDRQGHWAVEWQNFGLMDAKFTQRYLELIGRALDVVDHPVSYVQRLLLAPDGTDGIVHVEAEHDFSCDQLLALLQTEQRNGQWYIE